MQYDNLITKFYQAFSEANIHKMAECYDDNVLFKDPAFGTLQGAEVIQMWSMLLARSKGKLKITVVYASTNYQFGYVNWQAEYVFSVTGKKVINNVFSTFEFQNGLIIKHTDDFNLWVWAQQAFGLKGYLLGWSGIFKKQLQSKFKKTLAQYIYSKT